LLENRKKSTRKLLFIGQPNYETISSNNIGSIIAKVDKPEEKHLLMKREKNEWKKELTKSGPSLKLHEKFEA
jgi:hypothetical protein